MLSGVCVFSATWANQGLQWGPGTVTPWGPHGPSTATTDLPLPAPGPGPSHALHAFWDLLPSFDTTPLRSLRFWCEWLLTHIRWHSPHQCTFRTFSPQKAAPCQLAMAAHFSPTVPPPPSATSHVLSVSRDLPIIHRFSYKWGILWLPSRRRMLSRLLCVAHVLTLHFQLFQSKSPFRVDTVVHLFLRKVIGILVVSTV